LEKKLNALPSNYPRAEAILKEMSLSLEKGIIPAGIFNDQEIYDLEMERIFSRKWILVGHDSEIASPGDYVLRYIGEDPFIVNRDETGKINIMLDACRHRGVRICRAEKGNTSHFRCPYHGWTYKNNGDLIGMPAQNQAYNGMEKKDWGLLNVRTELLHGLIFACLDPDAPSLEEYLAGEKVYLDLLFGLQKEGLEVIGEPQRWIVNGNWKLAAENFSGDDYHLIFLHHSTTEVGATPFSMLDNMKGYHIQAGNGHCASISLERGGSETENKLPYWGFPESVIETFDISQMSDKEKEIVTNSKEMLGNIYPNSSFLLMTVSPDPKNIEPTPFISLRQWLPKGPGKIEIWNWFLMFKNTPDELKKASYRAGSTTFSMAGIFEMDDTLTWETATQSAGNYYAKRNLKLNYQMGLNNMGTAKLDPDWPLPGDAYYPRFGEGNQRYMYQTYLNDMLGE
jgi:nitrite reductase/ring-hydroxylating ferredoxin subunit